MKTRKVDTSFSEPDMTPMIDIVFQLLTFFMVAVSFENTQADERVKLPKDMLAKPPEVRPDNELVLNVGYEKAGAQGRPVVFYLGGQQSHLRDPNQWYALVLGWQLRRPARHRDERGQQEQPGASGDRLELDLGGGRGDACLRQGFQRRALVLGKQSQRPVRQRDDLLQERAGPGRDSHQLGFDRGGGWVHLRHEAGWHPLVLGP